MKRPSYLTRINDKPLKIVRLAPLPPARVKRVCRGRLRRLLNPPRRECRARSSWSRSPFGPFIFLMNRFGA
jgi:hypothetical protein